MILQYTSKNYYDQPNEQASHSISFTTQYAFKLPAKFLARVNHRQTKYLFYWLPFIKIVLRLQKSYYFKNVSKNK